MKATILDQIIEKKRSTIETAKQHVDLTALRTQAFNLAKARRNFAAAISRPDRTNIVAEFKRASPSRGVINDGRDPAATASAYKDGGGVAISISTDEDFFKGSLADLRTVRETVDLPILRKDFIIDEYQIYESAAAGADAILLIVGALSKDDLQRLLEKTNEIGLEAVVEVHDRMELDIAASVGAGIIGVNNRDLKTFEVSLDVSRDLIEQAPKNAIMISESGLKTRGDLLELRNLGYSAFLIGETLMRSGDPENELRRLAPEHIEVTEKYSV
jgi:indole-3-glycerol phosphate synthase